MEALEQLAEASSPYTRALAAHQLRYRVTTLSKEMPPDSFLKFINYLIKRISELLNAPEDTHKMAGVYAIYELISAQTKEVDVKSQVVRFANYLRTIIGVSNADPAVLKMAAKAIGRLAAVGSTVAPSFLGFEINRALERLEFPDCPEGQVFSSVCILREAAENAPTLFYKSIERFFKNIWTALSHNKSWVRDAAAKALGACLKLTKRRKSQRHEEYCEDIYNSALRAFNRNASTWDAVHGALLATRELVMHAEEFCASKFTEICSCTLKYREVRDRLIRCAIIDLLPRLAAFDPNGFVQGYVDITVEYLLGTLRDLNERGPAFVAVGSVALAVKDCYPLSSLRPQLEKIVSLIKEALTPKRNRPFCTDALKCIAMLSEAVGPSLITYMHDLLEPMFAAGLTPELTHALKQLVKNIPPLLELIQERLLHEISFILSGKPFPPPGQGVVSFLPSNAPSAVSAASKATATHLFRSRSRGGSKEMEAASNGTQATDGNTSVKSNKLGKLMGESMGSMSAAAAAVAHATNKDTMDMGLESRSAHINSAMIKSQQQFMASGPDSRDSRLEKTNITWTKSMLAGTATGGGGSAITNAKFSSSGQDMSSESDGSSLATLSSSSKKTSQVILTRVQRISLALRTLATFDFRGISLLPFVRHVVLLYADDPDLTIRRDSIVTTSMLLVSPNGCRLDKMSKHRAERESATTKHSRRAQEDGEQNRGGTDSESKENWKTNGKEQSDDNAYPAGIRNVNRSLKSVLYPEAWYLFLDRDMEPFRGEKLKNETDDSVRWNICENSSKEVESNFRNDGPRFIGGVLPVILMDAGPTLELVNEILQRLIIAAVGDSHPYIRMLTLQCLGAGMRGYPDMLSVSGTENPQLIKPEGLYTVGTNWAIEYQPKHHVIHPFGSSAGGWFDALLAQPVALRTLCFALHDEHHSVREMSVFLLGRLTHRNPASVMPALRSLLMEILQELELGAPARNASHHQQTGEDWGPEKVSSSSPIAGGQYFNQLYGIPWKNTPREPMKDQEQLIRLLGFVIKAAHRLVSPYVRPILKTLLPKLAIETATRNNRGIIEPDRDDIDLEDKTNVAGFGKGYSEGINVDVLPPADSNLVSSALSALGELSEIGAESMRPYLHQLVRLVIHTIGNRTDPMNQTVAVDTLTLLVGNAGEVVLPYIEHPNLLPSLLSLLRSGINSEETKTSTNSLLSSEDEGGIPWSLQKSVLRCIGVIGSLDPHRYQLSQMSLIQLKRNAEMFSKQRTDQNLGLATHERQANAYAAIQAATASAKQGRSGVLGVGGTDPNVSNVMATLGFDVGDDEDDEVGGWWWKWAWAQDEECEDGDDTLRDPASVIDGVDAVDPIMAAVEDISDEDTALSIKRTLSNHARQGRLSYKWDPQSSGTGGMLTEAGVAAMGAANQGRSAASILPSNFADRDVYFSTVALTSLLRILSDPSLTDHHPTVLQAVTWIFRSLGQRCVKFLPHVVPAFLNILRQRVRSLREMGGASALLGLQNKTELLMTGASQNTMTTSGSASLREAILQQLGVLVLLVKEHMRRYLSQLFGLLHELWPASLSAILRLVEHIALALPNEFNNYMPGILVHMLATLHHPADPLASSAEALARSARASGSGGYDNRTTEALSRYSCTTRGVGNDETAEYSDGTQKTDDALVTISPEKLLETGASYCRHILSSISSLGPLMEPYLDQIIPAILLVADKTDLPTAVRRHAVVTLSKLARAGVSLADHSSRILHCLSRVIAGNYAWAMAGNVQSSSQDGSQVGKSGKNQGDGKTSTNLTTLRRSACDLCCWLACQMREDFLVFVPLVRRSLAAADFSHDALDGLISMLLAGIPLPPDPVDFAYVIRELSWRDWIPFIDLEDLKEIRENLGGDMIALGSEVPVSRKDRERAVGAKFDGLGYETIDEDDEEYDHTNIDTEVDSSAQEKVNAALAVVTGATVDDTSDPASMANEGMEKLQLNEEALARAWDTEGRVTREDWVEWMRRLTVELLRHSPSPALRACWNPAQVYYPLARELFNTAFVSCWAEMRFPSQKQLLDAIETALHAPKTPSEILHALLNLAEFMEHDDKALPMDIRTLGRLAEKCQAYAKALRYKEREYEQYLNGEGISSNASSSAIHGSSQFDQYAEYAFGVHARGSGAAPSAIVESLISINNQLEQPEAAIGILKYTQAQATLGDRDTMGKLGVGIHTPPDVTTSVEESTNAFSWGSLEIKETWYEKLGRWEDALDAYNRKFIESYQVNDPEEGENKVCVSMPSHFGGFLGDNGPAKAYVPLPLQLGRMRCLKCLGEWVELQEAAKEIWPQLTERESRDAVAPLAAQSSWALGDWKDMETFSRYTQSRTLDGALFRAVCNIHSHKFESAMNYIEHARRLLCGKLSAVEAETYTRSYKNLVTVQQLTEMEEIIHYLRLRSSGELEAANRYMQHVRPLWERRLKGCQQNADVWQKMLSVRALVRQTEEDLDSWIKFANLSRREQRVSMSRRILLGIGMDGNGGFQHGATSTVVETGGLACFPPPQQSEFPQSSQKHFVTDTAVPMLCSDVSSLSGISNKNESQNTNNFSPPVLGVGVTSTGYFDNPQTTNRDFASSSASSELSGPHGAQAKTPGWAIVGRQSPEGPMPHAYPVRNTHDSYDGIPRNQQTYESALGINGVGLLGNIRPHPKVDFAFAKHLWASGCQFPAISHLTRLVNELDAAAGSRVETAPYKQVGDGGNNDNEDMLPQIRRMERTPYRYGFGSVLDEHTTKNLRMQCHLKLGEWKWHLMETHGTIDIHQFRHGKESEHEGGGNKAKESKHEESKPHPKSGKDHASARLSFYRVQSTNDFMQILQSILGDYKAATDSGPRNYRAWHAWALANFQTAQRLHTTFSSAADFPTSSQPSEQPEKTKKKRTSLGFGFSMVNSAQGISTEESEHQRRMIVAHVIPAVRGFFKSINLGRGRLRAHVLQDMLRLLTLWFTFGGEKQDEVRQELENGLASGFIGVDTWLAVVPQLIARIAIPDGEIRRLLHSLLIKVGVRHPQALVYPLTVAAKSTAKSRKQAALDLLDSLRETHPLLIDQAQLVSEELIRVAILWHEEWHAALEEASKLHFTEKNTKAMIETLLPLHEKVARGGSTAHELTFVQSYGRDLSKAHDWLKRYQRKGDENDVSAAWKIYYSVFKRIDTSLPQLKSIELQYVSQALLSATNLKLAIPGTYSAGFPVIRIRAFSPSVAVIPSKQRPRKLTLAGSDGRLYTFLLKGHEDLRQDERAMQLFGLVNTLLANDAETSKRDLAIRRYSVTPLSHNAGIVGWVPNCDTLHSLIEEHRQSRQVFLNVEHRLMQQMAPMYDDLTSLQKVEVFRYALDNTSGKDLDRVMWLKSLSSEMWLRRRTNYTRSLSVMSIIGYILGLGDRHPSNLMLDRTTGKVTHIDFGDCFEVAMRREKFPEKIPFRLTRMLVNAMEVSGIEGNFRSTAEATMRVLREHRDSVMAMLEAFVHDPLINWRLLATNEDDKPSQAHEGMDHHVENLNKVPDATRHGAKKSNKPGETEEGIQPKRRGDRERDLIQALGPEGVDAPTEALNDRAVQVLTRIKAKLTGRDFIDDPMSPRKIQTVLGHRSREYYEQKTQSTTQGREEGYSASGFGRTSGDLEGNAFTVQSQVQRLVEHASSHENLSQLYVGWCPFW